MTAVWAYAALIAGLGALAWQADEWEKIPMIRLGPWDVSDIPLIVVDAGHGGHDGGAVAGGVLEKNLALELSLQLRDQLLSLGLRVRMTREKDEFLSLEERSALADEVGADAFISVHLNTSSSAEVQGLETYFAESKKLSDRQWQQGQAEKTAQDARGYSLAKQLQRHACLATGAVDRGVKERNYAVVSRTQAPAALVECGFLTNSKEAEKLKQKEYQKKLVEGLAAGLSQFLKSQQSIPGRGKTTVLEANPKSPPQENNGTAP